MIEFRLSVASDEHRPIAHRHSVWLWEETKIQHVPICSKVWIPFFPFALVVFKVFSNTDSICCWVLWDVISPTTEHHHSISAQMWAVTQSYATYNSEMQHLMAIPHPQPKEGDISAFIPLASKPCSTYAKINAQKENVTPAFCFPPFRRRPQGFKDLHMCFTWCALSSPIEVN